MAETFTVTIERGPGSGVSDQEWTDWKNALNAVGMGFLLGRSLVNALGGAVPSGEREPLRPGFAHAEPAGRDRDQRVRRVGGTGAQRCHRRGEELRGVEHFDRALHVTTPRAWLALLMLVALVSAAVTWAWLGRIRDLRARARHCPQSRRHGPRRGDPHRQHTRSGAAVSRRYGDGRRGRGRAPRRRDGRTACHRAGARRTN